jgi:hypothetical protein
MPLKKRIICPARLRKVPPQFNWIDHRLVRDKHICGRSAQALALYLFLLTVADAQGLSYYADAAICTFLTLDEAALSRARNELVAADLIAWQKPLYQVLSLDEPAPSRRSQPMSLAEIFEHMKGQEK